jgi:hypothetical protein
VFAIIKNSHKPIFGACGCCNKHGTKAIRGYSFQYSSKRRKLFSFMAEEETADVVKLESVFKFLTRADRGENSSPHSTCMHDMRIKATVVKWPWSFISAPFKCVCCIFRLKGIHNNFRNVSACISKCFELCRPEYCALKKLH